jgi:hypothetical protein
VGYVPEQPAWAPDVDASWSAEPQSPHMDYVDLVRLCTAAESYIWVTQPHLEPLDPHASAPMQPTEPAEPYATPRLQCK